MSVPDDCKTIYVEQTVSNDICNGQYDLDEATKQWVNANDPSCSISKIYDSGTGSYKWAFKVTLPPDADPPPGSVYSVSFPLFRRYASVAGLYVQPAEENAFAPILGNESTDYGFGAGVTHPEAYNISNEAIPEIIEVGDDKLYLTWKAEDVVNERMESGADFYTGHDVGGEYPTIFHSIPNIGSTVAHHINKIGSLYSTPQVLDQTEIGQSSLTNFGNLVSSTARFTGPWSEYTFLDEDLGAFCAPYTADVLAYTNLLGNWQGEPYINDGAKALGLTRYVAIGEPLTYIIRNPFEDEEFYYDPNNPNPEFPFYKEVKARNENPETAWCASAGWMLKTSISSITDEDSMCPADGDWGDGVTVSKDPIDNGGGGNNGGNNGGNDIKPIAVASVTAEIINFKPNAVAQVSAVKIDRESYTGKTIASENKGWVYDERTSAISGPFDFENIQAVTTKDNSSEMFCVTSDNQIKKTDLLEFNNPNFEKFSDPFTQILEPFDGAVTRGIVLSESGEGFSYRNRYISKPFEDSVVGSGEVKKPLYFRDCYLSHIETNWMHLGDEHNEKQLHRVDMHFHKNSCGHLWLYAMSDDGLVKGQYRGEIKEHMKAFTNLRGRAFKILMFVATHYDHPWAMREMALGHLYGKSF